MANTQRDHLKQWAHNREFLATIAPKYTDWIVTVTFYVALQAVDALLAHDKVRGVTRHEERNEVLMRTNRYDFIQRHFAPLYTLSRTVRYLAAPEQWVRAEDIEKNVWRRYLYPIEESVGRLTGHKLDASPLKLAAVTVLPVVQTGG